MIVKYIKSKNKNKKQPTQGMNRMGMYRKIWMKKHNLKNIIVIFPNGKRIVRIKKEKDDSSI